MSRGIAAQEFRARQYLFQNFIATALGFLTGLMALGIWHIYGIGPVCIFGFRYMHFLTGLISMVVAVPFLLNRSNQFIGFFFVGFGFGLSLDDWIWHYIIIKDGFSLVNGCR